MTPVTPPDPTARAPGSLLVPSLLVAGIAALWGLYWIPVRALEEGGLTGAWGTFAITLAAVLALAPFAVMGRRRLFDADRIALISIALGGAAFTLYSIGFLYGRVAVVVLFYLLTPVWSTLIARFVMGWPTPILRYLAIVLGLAGLAIMLGLDDGIPLPRNSGEWLGLLGGLFWSVATVGIRARPPVPPVEASFVMAAGAALTALVLAPIFGPPPGWVAVQTYGLAFLTGAVWYGVLMAGLMWAATLLDPARVGILLMAEVLVAAVSAALLAGEVLTPAELLGGACVLAAGLVEIWPVRARRA